MKLLIKIFLILVLAVPVCAEQKYWEKGSPLPKLKSGLPWPKLNEVTVKANVVFKNENYTYSYIVYNSTKNWLPIYSFGVDTRRDALSHSLSRKDISESHSFEEHFRIIDYAQRVSIFNITSPNEWKIERGTENSGPCRWITDFAGASLIFPKSEKNGYRYQSKSPVGIRNFIAEAYSFEFIEMQFNVPKDKSVFYAMSKDLELEISKGIEYVGKTITPVAPPEPFTVSSWTIRMAEYAVEARKQKWIKTDRNLVEIKKLISGLNTEDKPKLKAIVKKIEFYVLAEKKKGNVTDEADALVRLNAQYLLQRLESPAEKPDEAAKKQP